MSSVDLIPSCEALAILRAVANRPHAARASLKALVDRGLIQAYPVHSREFLYSADEVRTVAARLAAGLTASGRADDLSKLERIVATLERAVAALEKERHS